MSDDAFDRYIDAILADYENSKKIVYQDDPRFHEAWCKAEAEFDSNPLENLEAFLGLVARLYNGMETPDSAG